MLLSCCGVMSNGYCMCFDTATTSCVSSYFIPLWLWPSHRVVYNGYKFRIFGVLVLKVKVFKIETEREPSKKNFSLFKPFRRTLGEFVVSVRLYCAHVNQY